MRSLAVACLTCVASLVMVPEGRAQQHLRVKLEKIRVGFHSTGREDLATIFKPGLWVPVQVTLGPDPNGNIYLPIDARDETVKGEVLVETADAEGVRNV